MDVINPIKKKTNNIFEYEELFHTSLPDYGSVSNILDKSDSRRIRFINDIRKDNEKVKVELIKVEDLEFYIFCFKCEECKEDQVHIMGINIYEYKIAKKHTLDHTSDSYLDYLELKMNNEVSLGYITIN